MTHPCSHESVSTHRQVRCQDCGATQVGGVWASSPTARLRELERLPAVVRKLVLAAGIEVGDDWIGYGCGEYSAPNDLTSDELAAYRAAATEEDT